MDPAAFATDAPQPPYDEDLFRKAHVREVGGQIAFTVGGVASAGSVIYTAACFATYNVTWQDRCLWPARIAVASTGLALGGGAFAVWGGYDEARSVHAPWVEGAIGVGALGASVPTLTLGGYFLWNDRPQAIPMLLAGVGLVDLGVASTACQVHMGHREARRYGLIGRSGMRLRNDFVFCGFLDAFTVAVSPTDGVSGQFRMRW